jgi:membrane-associated protein
MGGSYHPDLDKTAVFAESVPPMMHKLILEIVQVGGLIALVGVVFAETGLFFGFFLPGDSLLVTAGIYAASNPPLFNIVLLNVLLMVAAIVGDTVGYWVGAKAGPKLFTREQSLFFSKKHLLRTKEFYERHGGKTIIIARFMPFARTFAPVVAGIGRMDYRRFLSFNVVGGIGWVFSMTMLGYALSTIYPKIPDRIELVIIVIVFVSLLPAIISYLMNRKRPTNPSVTA